jgi:hypothetical protein
VRALRRVGRAARALVITPASLKAEWEEQIRRFTDLDLQIVYGARRARVAAYERAPFFTIVNYEQMVSDTLDVNARLRPDIVVLDEAQRIKNWSTKTAQAVKRLHSRYAFVLTGTPIENRIDELWSIVDFLDPARLGPLFRFNREFYELDERGRPEGYRNLAHLRSRVAPLMRRRRKADVESELPERTDRQFFVEMTPEQRASYESHEAVVARLAAIAKRRVLTQKEQERLLKELNIMRMLCDTPYILDPGDRTCPKRAELEKILDECCGDPEVKVLVFSEWEGMLDLARDTCRKLGLGFAWHTGRVPQQRRRGEILAFKTDPHCRVFLSTDSGGVGLNLQNASYVINCDLPWNPARLEQRIARAWRKHQMRPVTVINLVTARSIEAGMLVTLEAKQGLAAGVLDGAGDLDRVVLRRGKTAFLERLQQTLAAGRTGTATPALPRRPADSAQAFAQACTHRLDGALVALEERFVDGREDPALFVVTGRTRGRDGFAPCIVSSTAATCRSSFATPKPRPAGGEQNDHAERARPASPISVCGPSGAATAAEPGGPRAAGSTQDAVASSTPRGAAPGRQWPRRRGGPTTARRATRGACDAGDRAGSAGAEAPRRGGLSRRVRARAGDPVDRKRAPRSGADPRARRAARGRRGVSRSSEARNARTWRKSRTASGRRSSGVAGYRPTT